MVDDILFSKFILNQLSSEEMASVERLLLEDNESKAILHSVIAMYESNVDLAEELIGVEEEINDTERNTPFEYDRKPQKVSSIEMNKKQNAMNTSLSSNDRYAIEQLVESFHGSEVKDRTLNDNLVTFILSSCPEMKEEEALEVIDKMRNSISLFSDNLSNALNQGLDSLIPQIRALGEERTNEERYELLLNLLVLLNNVDANNFNDEELSDKKDIDTIRNEYLGVQGHVSEEDIEDIINEIISVVSNSSFSVITTLGAEDLLKEANNGHDLSKYVKGDNIREILITSVSTYVAHKNGQLEGEEFVNTTPEAIAVGVAAGFEELKVMARLGSGEIDDEEAWETIKIIGAIVGITLLLIASSMFIALTTTATFVGFLALFGDSLIVSIVGGLAGLAVGLQLATSIINAADWVLEKGWETLDRVVDKIRTDVIPCIKERVIKIKERVKDFIRAGKLWVKSVFSRNRNKENE